MSGCFAAAVPDGPLPSPPAGCVRLLSATLSREASAVHAEVSARWRADAARARQAAPPAQPPAGRGKRAPAAALAWAEILSPLHALGCVADNNAVLRSLAAFLAVQSVRASRHPRAILCHVAGTLANERMCPGLRRTRTRFPQTLPRTRASRPSPSATTTSARSCEGRHAVQSSCADENGA